MGAAFAVITAALPDWAMDFTEKLVLSVVTAFLTGVAFRAGGILIARWTKQDDQDVS